MLQLRHVAVDCKAAALNTRLVLRQPQVEVDGGRVGMDTDARGVRVAVVKGEGEGEGEGEG